MARRVIFFARYEASQLGAREIGSEHLLLGLLREDHALTRLIGLPPTALHSMREEIARERPPGEKIPGSVALPLSQESKRILAFAAKEAERLSDKHIGTEHLLLGILREQQGLAAPILSRRGIRLEEVREKLFQAKNEKITPLRPETSLLGEFLHDVTSEAEEQKLDPLIGREAELGRVVEILCFRSRNNPVLVGEAGVGKSALVEGLAMRIAAGEVPERLADKRILTFDLVSLVAVLSATRFSEERMQAAMRELERMRDAILYIEGLFAFAGGTTLGAAKLLKPLLDRGAVQCIAAARPAEYQRWGEREPWLKEYFYPVEIPPPGEADAIKILQTIKKRYEDYHGVHFSEEALRHAVYYSEKFLPRGHLPDKAIDLIDEAGAAVTIRRSQVPQEVAEARKRLKAATHRLENAIGSQEFDKANLYDTEQRDEEKKLRALEEKYHLGPGNIVMVGVEEIENILARWTNIPLETIRQQRRKA